MKLNIFLIIFLGIIILISVCINKKYILYEGMKKCTLPRATCNTFSSVNDGYLLDTTKSSQLCEGETCSTDADRTKCHKEATELARGLGCEKDSNCGGDNKCLNNICSVPCDKDVNLCKDAYKFKSTAGSIACPGGDDTCTQSLCCDANTNVAIGGYCVTDSNCESPGGEDSFIVYVKWEQYSGTRCAFKAEPFKNVPRFNGKTNQQIQDAIRGNYAIEHPTKSGVLCTPICRSGQSNCKRDPFLADATWIYFSFAEESGDPTDFDAPDDTGNLKFIKINVKCEGGTCTDNRKKCSDHTCATVSTGGKTTDDRCNDDTCSNCCKPPMYKEITSGICEDSQMNSILNKKDCNKAAEELGWTNTSSKINDGAVYPYGCYQQDGGLYVGTNGTDTTSTAQKGVCVVRRKSPGNVKVVRSPTWSGDVAELYVIGADGTKDVTSWIGRGMKIESYEWVEKEYGRFNDMKWCTKIKIPWESKGRPGKVFKTNQELVLTPVPTGFKWFLGKPDAVKLEVIKKDSWCNCLVWFKAVDSAGKLISYDIRRYLIKDGKRLSIVDGNGNTITPWKSDLEFGNRGSGTRVQIQEAPDGGISSRFDWNKGFDVGGKYDIR